MNTSMGGHQLHWTCVVQRLCHSSPFQVEFSSQQTPVFLMVDLPMTKGLFMSRREVEEALWTLDPGLHLPTLMIATPPLQLMFWSPIAFPPEISTDSMGLNVLRKKCGDWHFGDQITPGDAQLLALAVVAGVQVGLCLSKYGIRALRLTLPQEGMLPVVISGITGIPLLERDILNSI